MKSKVNHYVMKFITKWISKTKVQQFQNFVPIQELNNTSAYSYNMNPVARCVSFHFSKQNFHSTICLFRKEKHCLIIKTQPFKSKYQTEHVEISKHDVDERVQSSLALFP